MTRLAYAPVYIGLYCALMIAFSAAVYVHTDLGGLIAQAAFWGVIYAATLAVGWRHAHAPRAGMDKLVERLALVAAFVAVAVYLYAGWEPAMLAFLVIVQAARNLTLATRRDLAFAYVVSFVWIGYAAGTSKDAGFLVFVVLYVLAIVFTLMADHIDERMAQAQGGDGAELARGINFPVNVVATSAAVVGLGFLLYLATPRPPALGIEAFPAQGGTQVDAGNEQGRRGPGDGPQRGANAPGEDNNTRASNTGDSVDVMNPQNGTAGEGANANPILFYMQADRGLYLRAQVFDRFDGARWQRSDSKSRSLLRDGRGFRASTGEGREVGQVITLAVGMPPQIPAAFRASMIYFPAPVVLTDNDEAFAALQPLSKGLVYSVKSQIAYRDGHPYGAADAAPASGADLNVPAALSERARALAREVTAAGADPYARAVLLEGYLKTHYHYTLSTVGQAPAPDLVDRFLFETRAGHCEIFATTLATLLRTLDIPARFVTGYAATEYNPLTGYYEVRALNAHAWVEAFIPGSGWVMFEATPGYALPQSQPSQVTAAAVMRYLQQQLDSERLMQAQHKSRDLRADLVSAWTGLIAGLREALAVLRALVVKLIDAALHHALAIASCAIALTGAVIGARRWRWDLRLAGLWDSLRLRRADRSDARAFIVLCYLLLERALARHGLPRPAHWTHRDYQDAIAQRLDTAAVARLADLFGIARYSALRITRDQADAAYGDYRAVVAGLGSARLGATPAQVPTARRFSALASASLRSPRR